MLPIIQKYPGRTLRLTYLEEEPVSWWDSEHKMKMESWFPCTSSAPVNLNDKHLVSKPDQINRPHRNISISYVQLKKSPFCCGTTWCNVPMYIVLPIWRSLVQGLFRLYPGVQKGTGEIRLQVATWWTSITSQLLYATETRIWPSGVASCDLYMTLPTLTYILGNMTN